MDIASLVPLNARELLDTAMANTGLSDFGKDEWREPFEILVKAINEEAELNLFGRLMTRSDLLIWLQERLEIEETYRRHPEIEDEVVDARTDFDNGVNNVDIDAEMTTLATNDLSYRLATRLLSGRYNTLRGAIKGHLA